MVLYEVLPVSTLVEKDRHEATGFQDDPFQLSATLPLLHISDTRPVNKHVTLDFRSYFATVLALFYELKNIIKNDK